MRPREAILDWSFFFFLTSILFGLGLGAGVFSAACSAVRGEKALVGWKLPVSALLFPALQFGLFFAGYGIARSLAGNEDVKSSLVWAFLFLGVYFGGKMILTGLRDLKRGEPEPERAMRASENPVAGIRPAAPAEVSGGERPMAPEAAAGRKPMTAEEAVPGREITRTRVSDKIPVMWRVFLKAFSASGAAFAAGFSIPKLQVSGAFTEGGIIFLLSLVAAFAALLWGFRKEQKTAHAARIAGGVLVLAVTAIIVFRQISA